MLVLKGPGAGQVGADDIDRAERSPGCGGDRNQTVGSVGDGGQRIPRRDGGPRRAAGAVDPGVQHTVRIARQHAVQLRRGRVAQFDQDHDVRVGFGDGSGDGLDVGVPGPEICGIESQRGRAHARQGAAAREPLRPGGENQEGGDAQASDHGRPQPQHRTEQRQDQGGGQGRGGELGQKIGPAMADPQQGRQGDGGRRGQQAERGQMDRDLQWRDQADFLAGQAARRSLAYPTGRRRVEGLSRAASP